MEKSVPSERAACCYVGQHWCWKNYSFIDQQLVLSSPWLSQTRPLCIFFHLLLLLHSNFSAAHLKYIHISRMYLIKRNNLNQRGNLSVSMGFITLPVSRTDLTYNSVIKSQSNKLRKKCGRQTEVHQSPSPWLSTKGNSCKLIHAIADLLPSEVLGLNTSANKKLNYMYTLNRIFKLSCILVSQNSSTFGHY